MDGEKASSSTAFLKRVSMRDKFSREETAYLKESVIEMLKLAFVDLKRFASDLLLQNIITEISRIILLKLLYI